jgi:hypothetical protein
MGVMPKPEPVAKLTVCSLCGLDWSLHGEKPTMADCIRLLKAELERRPHSQVIFQNLPPAPALPLPGTWSPPPPLLPSTWCGVGGSTGATSTTTLNCSLSIVPDDPDDGCAPIGIPA